MWRISVRREPPRLKQAGWLLLVLTASACTSSASQSGPCAETQPGRAPSPALAILEPAGTRASNPPAPPRLVLWITVDQMRGDSLNRYAHLLDHGGLSRLRQEGLVFSAARFQHAVTETAPGHATLFTGAAPRDHGIVANAWLLPTGVLTESVSDPTSPLLGPLLSVREQAPSLGRSPRLLRAPTIGDALRKSTAGRAKVVAVSLKDRGAILPAGQSGDAYFLGDEGFVTTSYYQKDVPAWLAAHHTAHPLSSYLTHPWTLSLPEARYRHPASSHALRTRHVTPGFPHHAAPNSRPAQVLKVTPFGDDATLDLARSALAALSLGGDDTPDLLSISLSSGDYIGHYFGPESRESEDHFARLERSLGLFFDDIAQAIDWDDVLVILSSDHGVSDSPEHLATLGLDATRVRVEGLEATLRRSLAQEFGDEDLLLGVAPPFVYLDRTRIGRRRLDVTHVAIHVADTARGFPGVAQAFSTKHPPKSGNLAPLLHAAIDEERSGDVYLVVQPYAQWDIEGDLVANHGSPYSYDRHVPLVISGAGIRAGTVGRSVDVASLAGTVAARLGITGPPLAQDELLREALDPD